MASRIALNLPEPVRLEVAQLATTMHLPVTTCIQLLVQSGLAAYRETGSLPVGVNPNSTPEPELDLTAMTDEQRMELLFGDQT